MNFSMNYKSNIDQSNIEIQLVVECQNCMDTIDIEDSTMVIGIEEIHIYCECCRGYN